MQKVANQLSIESSIMQLELQSVKQKLDQVSRTLAQKDQLIDSLELDLEHMIDQLMKIQYNREQMPLPCLVAGRTT